MEATRRTALCLIAAALASRAIGRGRFAAGATIKPDREEMIPVAGGRVYVRINGQIGGSRPPIVLIHGGPGDSHWYLLNATALADDRAVILYDQLDSGRSDHPNLVSNWTIPRFASELGSIRKALGVGRWHVLGTSWGALIALHYAAEKPRALASTILSSPLLASDLWLKDARQLIGRMPAKTRSLLVACQEQSPPPAPECQAATTEFYRKHLFREDPPTEIEAYRDALPESFNFGIYKRLWGTEEFRATGTLKDLDATSLLDRLNGRRTLFVAGEFDEATPATVATFARKAGASFRVVRAAGHLSLNDNPDAYLAMLRQWLRSRDRVSL